MTFKAIPLSKDNGLSQPNYGTTMLDCQCESGQGDLQLVGGSAWSETEPHPKARVALTGLLSWVIMYKEEVGGASPREDWLSMEVALSRHGCEAMVGLTGHRSLVPEPRSQLLLRSNLPGGRVSWCCVTHGVRSDTAVSATLADIATTTARLASSRGPTPAPPPSPFA